MFSTHRRKTPLTRKRRRKEAIHDLCNHWLTKDAPKRLTADALHALTDLVSDIMTLATISYSLKPATSRFPTGYGKIESLGALAVSGLLLSGGIMIGLQALMALSQQFFPEIAHILSHFSIFGHGHSHSHGAEHFGPNINAAWLAGGSIIIKEWLYRSTMKIATQKRSSVLASNAYHHRVDSLTAFVALLTISASHFLTSAAWLDPVGGLAISGMIVQAGWGNTKSAMLELADVAMDEEVKGSVEQAAKTALQAQSSGEADIRGVQGIKSGQNFLVDIEVFAPSHYTVAQLDAIKDAMREQIASDVKGVRRVTVRFTADTEAGVPFADEFIAGKADGLDEHGHDHDHAEGHSSSTEVNGNASKRK
jgi:cation diffusion facilitator family transporter